MTDLEPSQFDFIKYTTDVFERLNVQYFVTGSIASMYYGEIRATNDIDIVAALQARHIRSILESFPSPDFYVSEDAIRDAIENRFQFNIIHFPSGLKADIIQLGDAPFDQSRLSRIRRSTPTNLLDAWIASPEDVIIKKLLYFKEGGGEKHLRDIAGMLRINAHAMDMAYIQEWISRFALQEIWKTIVQRENEAP